MGTCFSCGSRIPITTRIPNRLRTAIAMRAERATHHVCVSAVVSMTLFMAVVEESDAAGLVAGLEAIGMFATKLELPEKIAPIIVDADNQCSATLRIEEPDNP